MATSTLGTNATTTLTSLIFSHTMVQADMATIALGIKDDLGNVRRVLNEAFSEKGLLYVPNRGVLKIRPGDYVGVDSQGWPILVSANSIANGPWTHT